MERLTTYIYIGGLESYIQVSEVNETDGLLFHDNSSVYMIAKAGSGSTQTVLHKLQVFYPPSDYYLFTNDAKYCVGHPFK